MEYENWYPWSCTEDNIFNVLYFGHTLWFTLWIFLEILSSWDLGRLIIWLTAHTNLFFIFFFNKSIEKYSLWVQNTIVGRISIWLSAIGRNARSAINTHNMHILICFIHSICNKNWWLNHNIMRCVLYKLHLLTSTRTFIRCYIYYCCKHLSLLFLLLLPDFSPVSTKWGNVKV